MRDFVQWELRPLVGTPLEPIRDLLTLVTGLIVLAFVAAVVLAVVGALNQYTGLSSLILAPFKFIGRLIPGVG